MRQVTRMLTLALAFIIAAVAQNSDRELNEVYKQQVAELKRQSELITKDKEDMQRIITSLSDKVTQLEKQISLQGQNRELLQQMLGTQERMAAIFENAIKDRDNVIKELAKGNKRSAWERIADSIAPVAGIVSLAVTAR